MMIKTGENSIVRLYRLTRFVTTFKERSCRGCTKRLLMLIGMDEPLCPVKPLQKETVDVFVQLRLHLQRRWLQKLM